MKKGHKAMFLAFVLLLTTLCACGQQAEQAGQSEGSSGEPTKGFVTREPEKPSSKQSKEIAVTELYNEEGEGDCGDGFSYKTSYEKSSINQQKTFFLSVVKGGSLIKLPKCAFSKSIAVGIQTSYSRLYFTSVEMAVGSSFKDMSEMSHMHIGNGNGCRGLLEESPDRLLMNTEFEEALEF